MPRIDTQPSQGQQAFFVTGTDTELSLIHI